MAKDKKEQDPIDKVKQRQELVAAAATQFSNKMMDIAEEFGLSSAEVFAIMSKALHGLAEMAVQHEHEEYFGPGAEDQE